MTIEVPLWLQGGTYPARMDRLALAMLFDEGVMDLSCLKVTQRVLGANFTIDVSVGEAVIQGDDQVNQGNYLARVTVAETGIVIGVAPGANSRIDLVGLRMNDPNAGGAAGNTATVVVTAGAVAASPVAPATPASTLPLAYVTVAVGQASILNANITDARVVAGRRDRPGTSKDTYCTVAESGWLMEYGQAVSRTTYARLFAEIGTTHGVGDGSTTFNVPNSRGRVAVALDNMGGVDGGVLTMANTMGLLGGEEKHLLTTAEIPAHVHPITDPGHVHGIAQWGPLVGYYIRTDPMAVTTEIDAPNVPTPTGITVNANTGGGGTHNIMQPYILRNRMIRT